MSMTLNSSTLTMRPLVDCDAAVGELKTILKGFRRGQGDFLSDCISLWGSYVEDVDSIDDPADRQQFVAESVRVLVSEILVNPLDGRLLVDPILERDWVWESREHKKCSELFHQISPLDQGPMEEPLKSHVLARRMLLWLKTSHFVDDMVSETQMTLLNRDLSPEVQRIVYERLVKAALLQRAQQKLRMEMTVDLMQFGEETALIQRADQEALEAEMMRNQAHQALLNQQFDGLKTSFQKSLQELVRQKEASDQEYERRIGELERKDQVDGQVAAALSAQIQEIAQTYRRESAILDRRITDLNQQRLNEEERHRKETGYQKEELAFLTKNFDKIRDDLTAAEKQNLDNQGQIGWLRAENAALQDEVRSLRRKVKKLKRWPF